MYHIIIIIYNRGLITAPARRDGQWNRYPENHSSSSKRHLEARGCRLWAAENVPRTNAKFCGG